jgi:hypothetical protein
MLWDQWARKDLQRGDLKLIAEDTEKWAKVIRAAGIKAE